MDDTAADDGLLEKAKDGDHDALARLLLTYYDRLENYVRRKIPAELRSSVAVEDVLQESHVQAFRKIDTFEPRGDNAFYRWLVTIARRRVLDKIKAHGRLKRGGANRQIQSPQDKSSIACLVDTALVLW